MNEQRHPLDLREAAQAGVYRVMRADVPALLALADEDGIASHEIDVEGVSGKLELIARIHAALHFPDDWGQNWDALLDGLRDLSWLGDAAPRLLVWRGVDTLHRRDTELESTLCGVLEDASSDWADQGIALWSLLAIEQVPAEFIDPDLADSTRH
ncbi:MAG: barstar family protein [Pseudomonadota bacterium]|nr:barstar family protein [Pseudomonadota bacterium]